MEQQLQQAVHELKDFHEKFLSINPSENLITRNEATNSKSSEILSKIETELNNPQSESRKSVLLLLKGSILQLTSTSYSKPAAEALKKSVKLDPTYTLAWNELGESYWRNGDALQAKSCFEHAVKHSNSKNVDSLCRLSSILRQIPYENNDSGNKERSENLLKSLDLARKAIKLEVNSGNAWYTLGNAYLNMVTIGAGDIKQAITAYKKAEEIDQQFNPDLHFNKGQLLLFQCDFEQALIEFQEASKIDTEWEAATQKINAISEHLQSVNNLISTKGKLKPRKLNQLRSKLKNPENLRCGVVISSCSPTDHILAFSAICLLEGDNFVVIRINNLKDSVKIGDTLEFAKEMEIKNGNGVDYVSIKNPHTELLVNGRRMSNASNIGLSSSSPY